MLTACNSINFGRAAAGCTKGKKYRFWNAACLAVMMDAFWKCSSAAAAIVRTGHVPW